VSVYRSINFHEQRRNRTNLTSFGFIPLTMWYRSPQAALHFLYKFIVGEDLAPFLPSNSTLKKLDDASFAKAMEEWIKAARKPPYVEIIDV
jgi:hypothetical protein